MDKEIKLEARKQYLRYFRVWFVILGILAVVFAVVAVIGFMGGKERRNSSAPTERVYDYADVLTAEEEQKLREHIASCEARYQLDLVLVTINEDVESQGYWDTVMMNKADDFYDQNNYGYNKIHGDGALLLDNWYEDENGSQKGSWISGCGVVERWFGTAENDEVLDAVFKKIESDPYAAYKAYVDKTCAIVDRYTGMQLPWLLVLGGPILVALIYAFVKLRQAPAKDTTTSKTYVAGGAPVMNAKSDNFIRKHVVTRRIETSSSSGGSRSGGGRHVSSGGVRHSGGGRRR